MSEKIRLDALIEGLLAEASTSGGVEGGRAARKAAALAERRDFKRAVKALELAARLDPLDSFARLALSRLSAEAGDLEAARREAAGVFAKAVDEAARARAAFMLGEIARSRGDAAEARDAYSAVADIENALLAKNRTDVVAARWYARATGRLAELDAGENPLRARANSEGVLALLRALADQIGEQPALSADIADAEFRVAVLDLDEHNPYAAHKHLAEAIGRYEALCVLEPGEPHWRAVLAESQALGAETAFALGSREAARAAMDKALQLRIKLATVDPNERWPLAAVWRLRAALLDALGDPQGAADCLIHAGALAKQLRAEATPNDPAPARFLVHTLFEQTDLALRQSLLQTAHGAASEARALAEPFAQVAGAQPEWRADLAAAWSRLGDIALASRAEASAREALARASELRRLNVKAEPENTHAQRALAGALLRQGEAALAAKDAKTARLVFSEAVQLRLELAEATPGELAPARDMAIALERLGLAAAAGGDSGGARAVWDEEWALIDRIYPEPTDVEGQRMRAVLEAHYASLGGIDAAERRASALARLDLLAQDNQITERDMRLRKQLWQA
ncbi:MAG: hypothetical protein ABUS57_04060 [Pseudomonadota bacterium]